MAASVVQSHVQARGHAWIIGLFIHSFTGLGRELEAVGSRAEGYPAHWSLESIGEKVKVA